MRVAVFLPNWIGDAVMATPAIRALREHFGPDAEMVGVMRPIVGKVLAGLDWFDETILFQPRAADHGRRGRAVVARLRRSPSAWHVLLPNSLRVAAMSRLGRGERRVGVAANGRGWLLTDPVRRRDYRSLSAFDLYQAVAQATGADVSNRRMELATTAEDEQEVDALWRRLHFSPSHRVTLVNNGGAFGPSKLWPSEHAARFCRMLADSGRTVLVVCGPDEAAAAEAIAAGAASSRVQVASRPILSLGGLKSVCRRADALVSTDTGPRHIASAMGVPAVVLFGPLAPEISENYAATETRLWLKPPCAPCRSKTCPLEHHRCMRDLSPELVFERTVEAASRIDASRTIA